MNIFSKAKSVVTNGTKQRIRRNFIWVETSLPVLLMLVCCLLWEVGINVAEWYICLPIVFIYFYMSLAINIILVERDESYLVAMDSGCKAPVFGGSARAGILVAVLSIVDIYTLYLMTCTSEVEMWLGVMCIRVIVIWFIPNTTADEKVLFEYTPKLLKRGIITCGERILSIKKDDLVVMHNDTDLVVVGKAHSYVIELSKIDSIVFNYGGYKTIFTQDKQDKSFTKIVEKVI